MFKSCRREERLQSGNLFVVVDTIGQKVNLLADQKNGLGVDVFYQADEEDSEYFLIIRHVGFGRAGKWAEYERWYQVGEEGLIQDGGLLQNVSDKEKPARPGDRFICLGQVGQKHDRHFGPGHGLEVDVFCQGGCKDPKYFVSIRFDGYGLQGDWLSYTKWYQVGEQGLLESERPRVMFIEEGDRHGCPGDRRYR